MGLGAALGLGWVVLPLLGAGATMTSRFGATAAALGTEAALGTAAALGTEPTRCFLALASAAAAATSRFGIGGTDAALGAGAALGTEAARGFLALSSAASAAARRFVSPVALGTEAARGGARGTDVGVGPSFVAGAGAVVGVFSDVITFLSPCLAALAFACARFKNRFAISTGG